MLVLIAPSVSAASQITNVDYTGGVLQVEFTCEEIGGWSSDHCRLYYPNSTTTYSHQDDDAGSHYRLFTIAFPGTYNITLKECTKGNTASCSTVDTETYEVLSQTDITDLVDALEADTTALENEILILQGDITDLQNVDVNLWIAIDALNARVDSVDSQIANINTLIASLDANYQAQFADINTRLTTAEAGIVDLRNDLELMNHGTLSIVFDGDQDNGFLRVKGEAPLGAVTAKIHIRDNDRDYYTGISPNPRTITIDISDNSYRYDYTNVLDWDWQTYDVAVEFLDSSNNTMGQWVNETFYNLEIMRINAEIDAIETQLDLLWDDSTEQWNDIADLNVQIIAIYAELVQINADIATIQGDVSALEGRVSTIETTLVAMNHGTMEMRFRQDTLELDVFGEPPIGATNANLRLYDAEAADWTDTPLAQYTTSIVNQAGRTGWYEFHYIDLSQPEMEGKILNVQVWFGGVSGLYKTTDILEALAVIDLNNQVNTINDRLQVIDANIVALWEDSENQAEAIAELEEDVEDIFDELEVINERLDELESDVAFLKNRVRSLQRQINVLRRAMKAMNHATINIMYNSSSDTLVVWGEAAYGTDIEFDPEEGEISGIDVILISTEDGSIAYEGSADFTLSSSEYNIAIPTGSLDAESYNVIVAMTSDFRPYGSSPLFIVGTIFDTLAIDDLEERVSILEDKVEKLDDGTVEFLYDSEENELTIGGEAPTEAKCAKIWTFSSSGSLLGYSTTGITQSLSDYDYEITKGVSGWPQEGLNIYVQFYEKTHWLFGCRNEISTIYDSTEALLSEDLFGFRDITVSTYVTSYYVNDIKVPISFALKPDNGGLLGGTLYKIEYEINSSGNWEELEGCSWYDEGVKTYHRGYIELDSTGTKRVKLRAKQCGWFNHDVDYESYTFKIKHVDLKDELTAATTITSPTENSNMDYPYPVGSVADNVFWTQSGPVALIAYLVTNTEQDRPTCEVYYYDQYGVERHIGNYPTTADEEEGWVCDAAELNFGTPEWNGINHTTGYYTTLRVYNDVVAQPDSYDEVMVGIDNISPSINSITPDETGIMNGIYRWLADITDDLSGINTANFYLIEKDGEEYCRETTVMVPIDDYNEVMQEQTVEECWIGEGALVWAQASVPFDSENMVFYYDLNTLMFPDGDYNVAFEAYDVAGNYSYLEIDPIIDNTPPKIHSITVTPSPLIRGADFLVDANVSDKITGVDTVIATITGPGVSEVLVLAKNGKTIYSGIFSTDMNWNIGTYTVTIDANDFAGNTATNSITVELYEDYAFNLALNATTVLKGTSMTLTGHLVSDTGREVGDDNVVVSTTVLFADTLVHTDVNGNFSLDFVALDTGTFTITVTYNDGNTTYTDNVTLVVNLPSTPPVEPPEAPVVGGGGGGGGGSGRPEENIQLKVSPETVLVGEEVSIEALCKWAFGCRLYINGNIVSQMTNSAGFQDFSRAFSEAGTYTIELYKKGTTDTLISRKTVTVNAPQNTGENENSGNDGTTPDEVYIPTYADTGTGDNSTGETPTEDGTEGNAPTGFFGLGPNFELGNMNFLNIFLLIIGMIALGIGLNEVVLIKKG